MADNPHVAMETSKGTITLELYPDKAPETVANFLRAVDAGFYAGTVFHRVIRGFMIQGGGLDADLEPKDWEHELVTNEAACALSNERGTIAMARTADPHSATVQFFINTVDNSRLDHISETPHGYGYCAFGKVVGGMDVVDAIETAETESRGMHGDVPCETIAILGASRA